MASLSLPGKGVANSVGGEGGSREGKQPLERFNCSDNRLGFKKKKKKISPKLLLHNTELS